MSRIALFALALCGCNLATEVASATPAPRSPAPAACDAAHDHCVKRETWFLADTRPSPGRMSPVTPVHEGDGCWLDYTDDDYARRGVVYRTAVADAAAVKPGDVLIVLQPNDNEPPYPSSVEAAQTTARWTIAVVDALDARTKTFTIESRRERPISLAAARAIVETRDVERAKCRR